MSYLTRSKMLPVEGVVYCLEHTAVHENTTDPYGYGEPDCSTKEHRTVYYRGRKGDVDETADTDGAEGAVGGGGDGGGAEARFVGGEDEVEDTGEHLPVLRRRVIAATSGESLSDEERGLVVWLVGQARTKAQEVVTSLHEIFDNGAGEVAAVQERLRLLDGVLGKLGNGNGGR